MAIILLYLMSFHQTDVQAFPPTPEEIRQQLINESKLGKSSKVTKVIKPQSKDAEQIIVIKSSTCQTVAKGFKDFDAFLEEYRALDEKTGIIELVNEMRKCHKGLPIITAHKAAIVVKGVGTILLERAKGKTLNDAYIDRIGTLNDQKIKDVFTSIGKQFGALDKLMYTGRKQVLIHGDAHGGNFLYDEKGNQLYWIDNGTLEFIDDTSGIEFIAFLGELKHANSAKKLSKLLHDFILQKKPGAIQNPFGMEIDGYIPYIKDIPASKLPAFKVELSKLALERQKEILAIKSFKDGYLSVNPAGKSAYYRFIEDEDFNEKLNKVQQTLSLPQNKFPSLAD